jgi:hypothetical protein
VEVAVISSCSNRVRLGPLHRDTAASERAAPPRRWPAIHLRMTESCRRAERGRRKRAEGDDSDKHNSNGSLRAGQKSRQHRRFAGRSPGGKPGGHRGTFFGSLPGSTRQRSALSPHSYLSGGGL